LMLQNKITRLPTDLLGSRPRGLPVVDGAGLLVGIITEGDFLRRAETGTQRKRPRWLEFLTGPGRLAGEYVRTHGRKVSEIMTPDPVTAAEDTPLDEVVQLMEQHRIKRLPVVRGRAVVGIISRANLLHALASVVRELPASAKSDTEIRERILAELAKEPWAPRHFIDPVVRNGTVELWGTIFDDRERQGAKVVAENIAGVKAVKDHLVWVEPMSGMAFEGRDAASSPMAGAL